MTQQLTKYHAGVPVEYYQWAPLCRDAAKDERSSYVRAVIAAGANDGEWEGFVEICNAFRLNPLQSPRPIWLIRYEKGEPMVPQIGIAGYRIFAARTGRYAGSSQPEWAGKPRSEDADVVWRTAWLYDDPPAVARVGVWATNFRLPVWGVATFREFAKWVTYNGQRQLRSLWKTYPSLMLAKCAEKQALCKAFPEQLAEAEALQLFAADDAPALRTAVTEAQLITPQHYVPGATLPSLGPARPSDLYSEPMEDALPEARLETEPAPAQRAAPMPESAAIPRAEKQNGGINPGARGRRVKALADRAGWDGDRLAAELGGTYGVETLDELTATQADELTDMLMSLPAVAAAAGDQGELFEGKRGDPVDASRRNRR